MLYDIPDLPEDIRETIEFARRWMGYAHVPMETIRTHMERLDHILASCSNLPKDPQMTFGADVPIDLPHITHPHLGRIKTDDNGMVTITFKSPATAMNFQNLIENNALVSIGLNYMRLPVLEERGNHDGGTSTAPDQSG